MEYDNTNKGTLWGNDRKTDPSQPDFKGDVNVEGVEYWVSAWKRKPDANPKAPPLKFSISKKETSSATEAKNAIGNDGFDDDLPF